MSQLPALAVTVNQRQLKEVEHLFRRYPKQVNRIMSVAVNRTAAHGLKKMVKIVGDETGLLHRVIKAKHIKVKKASFKVWVATIFVSGVRIPLIQFKTHPKKPTPGGRRLKGVSWKIGKSPRIREENAFVARMDSGHVGVFQRRIKGGARVHRLEIDEMYGPSIPHVVGGRADLQEVFQAELGAELAKHVSSRVKFVLDRKGRS